MPQPIENMPKDKFIFKLVNKTIWQEAEDKGVFKGAGIDLEDGYIHFSTAEQVVETAKLHYKGQENLLLVAVSTQNLSDKFIYEASRGGSLFPHLYEPLELKHVAWKKPLPLVDGQHQFPEL